MRKDHDPVLFSLGLPDGAPSGAVAVTDEATPADARERSTRGERR